MMFFFSFFRRWGGWRHWDGGDGWRRLETFGDVELSVNVELVAQVVDQLVRWAREFTS